MLVLGLVLILLAAAVGAGAVFDGGEKASVELLGTTVDTTVAGVFFTGAATMLLLLLGVWLVTASMGRARRKRAERKDAKRRQRDSVQALEEERAQLRAENERLAGQLGSGMGSGVNGGSGGADGSRDTRSAASADGAGSADGGRTAEPMRADSGDSDTRVDHGATEPATEHDGSTRPGAPLRESDGPTTSQGAHAAGRDAGAGGDADLRQHETTTTRRDGV